MDMAKANMLALKKEEATGETFNNFGTGAATKINQLASALLEITKNLSESQVFKTQRR
jgi:nucleoside-diphosphate-sugar epimerase